MADFQLSRLAKADVQEIAAYTLERWGVDQAVRYLDGFEDACRLLAGQPMLGKAAESVMPGLRRHPYGEHVVFYRVDDDGVLVVRVLHHSMDEGRHL